LSSALLQAEACNTGTTQTQPFLTKMMQTNMKAVLRIGQYR